MIQDKIPEILNIPVETLDLGNTTVDNYLKELVISLWVKGEEFNSKRPFGGEGWKWEISEALVKKYKGLGRIKDGSLWGVNEKLDIALTNRINKIFEYAHLYEDLQDKKQKEQEILQRKASVDGKMG